MIRRVAPGTSPLRDVYTRSAGDVYAAGRYFESSERSLLALCIAAISASRT